MPIHSVWFDSGYKYVYWPQHGDVNYGYTKCVAVIIFELY